jgi:hypothetical protein
MNWSALGKDKEAKKALIRIATIITNNHVINDASRAICYITKKSSSGKLDLNF